MPSKKSPLNCFRQTSKKYTSPKRKSPPFKANQCCGEIMTGNDGNRWTAVMNAKNICQWKSNRTDNATKPKPAKKCPKGKVRSASGRCVKEKKPSATKPKQDKSPVKKTKENSAKIVAQLTPYFIQDPEYQWAERKVKTVTHFKKNQHKFDILTPIKDWDNGDVIIYNPHSPGVNCGFVSGTKIIPEGGEDVCSVPEEITKYTDDIYSMYKKLIDGEIIGETIYLSNKDVTLKKFLKPPLLKKVHKIQSKRPIFSLSINKLIDETKIYLQVSYPPQSSGWPKNYRSTSVVGVVEVNKKGTMGKGKIDDEKELVGLIERSIGGKL